MSIDPNRFRKLVSGQSRGPLAAAARTALRLLSWPYAGATSLRNFAYDIGLMKVRSASVPVVSIGNLTTGGTGKTPMVAAVVQQLQTAGHTPGIVSRGYHADKSGTNDEKRVLARLCPEVPHLQGADRVAVAQKIVNQHSVSIIVLDDGFQHRRIHRDFNIVLIDATEPFGEGYLLPRGFLRESIGGLKRADLVCVTRSDQVDSNKVADIERQVRPHLSTGVEVYRVNFAADSVVDRERTRPADWLQQRSVYVATAIGNPDAFVRSLQSLGAYIAGTTFFPDHHHFSLSDVEEIQASLAASSAEVVVTTLKDFVKLDPLNENLPMCFLNIEAQFSHPISFDQFAPGNGES